jgi:hypothetical protein
MASSIFVTELVTYPEMGSGYITGMVTKKARIYLADWIKFRGYTPGSFAAHMGENRETVHRWIKEPERLTPGKMQRLATALEIEPQELWAKPGVPSIDAMLAGADEKVRARVARIVRDLISDE